MIALVEQPYKCVHCSKSFMQDKTLVSHMCERKRRALQKDEKRVQAGFMAFNRFWQLTQNAKIPKTYDNFADSSYYNAFVKFGSFINNVRPLYPDKFIDYVIKSGVKLDHWCRDELYETYLFDVIKTEPVESAVQRSLQNMIEWGDENKAEFNHYFNYVSLNRAVNDIRNGYISPWVVLNTSTGQTMIRNMSDDQLNMISPAFDVPFWLKKFKSVPADVALVKEICQEAGIK
jgi:predicted nucleic acid-binding Zn ribbon protein